MREPNVCPFCNCVPTSLDKPLGNLSTLRKPGEHAQTKLLPTDTNVSRRETRHVAFSLNTEDTSGLDASNNSVESSDYPGTTESELLQLIQLERHIASHLRKLAFISIRNLVDDDEESAEVSEQALHNKSLDTNSKSRHEFDDPPLDFQDDVLSTSEFNKISEQSLLSKDRVDSLGYDETRNEIIPDCEVEWNPLLWENMAIKEDEFLQGVIESGAFQSHQHLPSKSNPAAYKIVWIAPLEIEARAAWHMMDQKYDARFRLSPEDDYVYSAGSICGFDVAIATLPLGHVYGADSVSALVSQVKRFFPNLLFGLLVGVAAGLPNHSRAPPRDIRLGDVLVALPEGGIPGLIAYDLTETGFRLQRSSHTLATAAPTIRVAIGSLKRFAPYETKYFLHYYEAMKNVEVEGLGDEPTTFIDPGQEHDELYRMVDGIEEPLERPLRPISERTRVWYGAIGSGEKLVKREQIRDELRDQYNLIGLEMEALGTMDSFPIGVIRGVCDYGDGHENKQWQPYAAAMAAAYAKAVLAEMGHGLTASNAAGNQLQAPGVTSATFSGRGVQNSGSGNFSVGGNMNIH
ncbi:hypothetical protein ABKA04_004791 [Annulohypoxylon sp. FPYF3050]